MSVGPYSAPINEDFSDLAQSVDIGFSLRFEAHSKSGWALFGDVFYADLGGEGTDPDSNVTVVVDQKELILEAGAAFEVVKDLEVLAVARYNDLRIAAGLKDDPTPPIEAGIGWIDLFGGLRYSPAIGEKWLLVLRGEVGGGGSKFSWFGSASINYWFNEGTSASLGWRALSVDRQEDSGFTWDMVMQGMSLGVLFTF